MKELLQKLLLFVEVHTDKNNQLDNHPGLCSCVWYMRKTNQITFTESEKLSGFISKNRPTEGIHFFKIRKTSEFYWNLFDSYSRRAWLTSMIELLD